MLNTQTNNTTDNNKGKDDFCFCAGVLDVNTCSYIHVLEYHKSPVLLTTCPQNLVDNILQFLAGTGYRYTSYGSSYGTGA